MKRKILFLACLILCCVISFQMIAAGEVSNQNLTDSENSDTVQAVETDDEKILADDENEEIMQSTQDSEVLKKDVHESDLESHRTANPITALLAVLISAGVCQLRRLKK